MPLSRRRAARLLLGGALTGVALPLLAACQTAANPATAPASQPTQANPLVKPKPVAGADLTALQASSELALGRNRFAIGLLDARNQPVTSGTVTIEFFKLKADGTGEKKSESAALFRSVGGQSKGVWVVSPVDFSETGPWGAQVSAASGSDAPKVARMNFEVTDKFSAPGYGDPAVRSATPTEKDVGGDLSHLCTNQPPCKLHAMSIAQALEPGQKPLVAAFATPALCTSATCGPELDAILQLNDKYGEQANFVHVEIYQYPFDGSKVAPAVDEWHLPSDPWIFVIDKSGIVRDRFEGATPADEIEPALKAVLS
jgi:hypothetical protein